MDIRQGSTSDRRQPRGGVLPREESEAPSVRYVLDMRKVVATAAALVLVAGTGTALAFGALPHADAHEELAREVVDEETNSPISREWQGPAYRVAAGPPTPSGYARPAAEPVAPVVPSPEELEAAEEQAAMEWEDSEDIDRADLRISTPAEIRAWGKRIDAYLEGTTLEGYGNLFAECAAEYEVDPRLSPAISRLESGCGAVCAAPHNAWGWGGPGGWRSWGSWEEAIDGHVSGLASGGYASMGVEECTRYCSASYWDGNPGFCLKTEVLSI